MHNRVVPHNRKPGYTYTGYHCDSCMIHIARKEIPETQINQRTIREATSQANDTLLRRIQTLEGTTRRMAKQIRRLEAHIRNLRNGRHDDTSTTSTSDDDSDDVDDNNNNNDHNHDGNHHDTGPTTDDWPEPQPTYGPPCTPGVVTVPATTHTNTTLNTNPGNTTPQTAHEISLRVHNHPPYGPRSASRPRPRPPIGSHPAHNDDHNDTNNNHSPRYNYKHNIYQVGGIPDALQYTRSGNHSTGVPRSKSRPECTHDQTQQSSTPSSSTSPPTRTLQQTTLPQGTI